MVLELNAVEAVTSRPPPEYAQVHTPNKLHKRLHILR